MSEPLGERMIRPGVASGFGPGSEPTEADLAEIERLLDRAPHLPIEVAVRARDGSPVVITNEPILSDGRPMPTRYWLVGAEECLAVSRLESVGGVRDAAAAIAPEVVLEMHERYARERDQRIPHGFRGHRPGGGVAGTRVGVKCLHAHYGWWLAGGPDAVGAWVADQLSTGEWSDGRPSRDTFRTDV